MWIVPRSRELLPRSSHLVVQRYEAAYHALQREPRSRFATAFGALLSGPCRIREHALERGCERVCLRRRDGPRMAVLDELPDPARVRGDDRDAGGERLHDRQRAAL